jgi:neutral ceramidase
LRKFPPRKIAEENVKKAELGFERLKASNAKYIDLQNAELKLLGAEDILGYIILSEKNIKPELLTDELPAEIQVLGIGDARIVGLQGEIFVEYGLEIKNRSPFEKTFVIELANGVLPGYVYTKEALKEGGYETDTSMLGENCGEIITKKAIELLNKTK